MRIRNLKCCVAPVELAQKQVDSDKHTKAPHLKALRIEKSA